MAHFPPTQFFTRAFIQLKMAISRFYVLIAFAACAAQLAYAGVVPEARDVAARAPSYAANEVREAVRSILIRIVKNVLSSVLASP